MKKLLLTSLILLCMVITQQAKAQAAHNFGQCYLNKDWKPNTEGVNCPACRNKIDKEKTAKQAEQKRRDQAIWDKAKAEKEAREIERLEKIRLAKEEAKRMKEKEASDKITRDAMMKKNNEIAEKGRIKSPVKGKEIVTHPDVDKIETFSDNKRRVYGFKVDGIETKVFPFEGYNTRISRIEKSNFFHVRVYSKHSKYDWDVYSHSYLVNHLGEKLIIDGIDKFDCEIEIFENTIFLIKWLDIPQIIDITEQYCYRASSGVITIYDSHSSAISALESLKVTHGGYAMCYNYKVCNVNQYKADLSGKLLEKNKGYQLFSFRK